MSFLSANADMQQGRSESVASSVRALRRNAELYHQGVIDHYEFAERNRTLWKSAEQMGHVDDVKTIIFGTRPHA